MNTPVPTSSTMRYSIVNLSSGLFYHAKTLLCAAFCVFDFDVDDVILLNIVWCNPLTGVVTTPENIVNCD